MITDKEIWDYEKNRLQRVMGEIELQLENGINSAKNFKKEAIQLQKEMWEDVKCTPTSLFDLEDATQIWQFQMSIANQARKYKFSHDMVSRLERMHHSPYFGRIDFLEDGEANEEQIYIGIYNLSTSSREILVYDWRAPISSMFYDFETGLCGYDCPAGRISGQMLLKRQYKIENRNIVYMFDSSLSINDEMLREILGKSTDTRMKTIVTSIQREQNMVIRNNQDRILIVEGPAGSGKTSIALHRAAYLLYKYRESLKSENILVFSPNHVFEDYISNVLPELGEENVRRSTFADFFENIFDGKYGLETMNQQMEFILSGNPNKTRLDSIRFKSSVHFLTILIKYVQYLEAGMNLKFNDLLYDGELVISAEDIYRLFREDYRKFPYVQRLEKLRQRLIYLVDQHEEDRVRDSINEQNSEEERRLADVKAKAEYEQLKSDIIRVTALDIHLLYKDLFSELETLVQPDAEDFENLRNIGVYTVCQLEKDIINYEDVAPFIFLTTVLGPVKNTKTIKHIIIDEAQDYTAIHYEIFRKVFEYCNMTILGDVNQSVNGYMNIGSFDTLTKIFNPNSTKSISLLKSYRSSKEIADFCKEILKSQNDSEQLNRHGNKPKIIKVDKNNLCRRVADDISKLKAKGHKLIAVICKTAGQCEAMYKSIHSLIDIELISNQNEEYQGGVVIIPSYLAKGLEFDAVLVHSIEDKDYSKAEEQRLLYTVCTRALHELYLYYFDNMSDFIKRINEDYYTME